MSILKTEPIKFTAGNNVYWDKVLSEYPTSEYLLTYKFSPISGGEGKEFYAFGSPPNTHQIRISPSDSIQFAAGEYLLTGTITGFGSGLSDIKQTVYTGRIQVEPSPESIVDRRTFAEAILDDLQSTYKKIASNSIQSATVNGRTYTRNTLEALRKEIIFYKNEVRNEKGGSTRKIAVTFKRPT